MPEQQTSYEDAFLKKEDWSEGVKDKAAPLKICGSITLWPTDSENGYGQGVKYGLERATSKIDGNVLNYAESFKINRLYMDLGSYMFEAELVPAKNVTDEYRQQVAKLMQGLFGHVQPGLEKCVKLIGGDHFNFSKEGFQDPSWSGWEGQEIVNDKYEKTRGIVELIRWAHNYQAFTAPEHTQGAEEIQIEFTPTFQALRNIDKNLFHPEDYKHGIRGKTFVDCVNNFRIMYEKAVTFAEWTGEEDSIPKIARLILPNSK